MQRVVSASEGRIRVALAAGALAVVAAAGCGGSHSSSGVFWGSTDAQLELRSTTTTFTNHCGSVTLSQPTPESNGDITMTGPFPTNIPSDNDTYTGHVNGNTMTLTVTNSSHATLATYTLTHGVHGQVIVGTCP